MSAQRGHQRGQKSACALPSLHALALDEGESVGSARAAQRQLVQNYRDGPRDGPKKSIQKKEQPSNYKQASRGDTTPLPRNTEFSASELMQQEHDVKVLTRALDNAFLCMPAPFEAFPLVFLVAVNRMLVGFDAMEESFADNFDNTVVEILEVFAVEELFYEAQVGANEQNQACKPGGDQMDVGAAFGASASDEDKGKGPFDDFSKYENAVRKPLPEDDGFLKLLSEQFSRIVNPILNLWDGRKRDTASFNMESFKETIVASWPILLRACVDIYSIVYSPDRELTQRLNEALNSMKSDNMQSSMDTAKKVFFAMFSPSTMLSTVYEQVVVKQESGWEYLVDFPERVGQVAVKVADEGWWFRSSAGYLARQKVAYQWAQRQTQYLTGFKNCSPMGYIGHIIEILSKKYFTFQVKSIQAYVNANGTKVITKAKKQIIEKAKAKNVTSDMAVCNEIAKNLKGWKESHQEAYKLVKEKENAMAGKNKSLTGKVLSGVGYLTKKMVSTASGLPIAEIIETLVAKRDVSNWRAAVKKHTDSMIEASNNLTKIYQRLTEMRTKPKPPKGVKLCTVVMGDDEE